MAAQLVFDRRPRAVMAVNDSLIMIRRSCTHIIRNTDQLLGAFFQPIMFLVLFAAVFGGAISKALPPGTNYLDFLMPGIIVQTLAFAGIILLFTLAFSWLAAIVGVVARSVEAVQWLTFVLVFPLTFASTTFVPADSMNPILKVFAENQPITQIVEAVRALMLGEPIGNYGWLSVGWSVGILLVAAPL